jgi:peroxiredoxin
VLNTCDGGKVRIGGQTRQQVVYFYPGNGTTIGRDSDTLLADDEQHEGFRDAQDELTSLGYLTVGVSSQSAQEQQAAVIANRMTHQLASDESLRFAGHVNVPTFERGARRCYQRLTIITSGDTIRDVIYPIATPRLDAAEVIERLKARRS